MQNTSCGDKCPFVKNGMCKDVKDCPNYQESWWIQQGEATPKLICDCVPKRMMIQQQYLQLRLEQVQASLEASTTQYNLLANQMKKYDTVNKQCAQVTFRNTFTREKK